MKRLKQGDILDSKYRIESKIGVGPFGTVWLGRSELLNRQVAIKELLRGSSQMEDEEFRAGVEHFRHEARLRAQFEHPNIVRVFELLEENEVLYLVQEFVGGGSLEGLISQAKQSGEPIPQEMSVQLTSELLSALQALHEHPNKIVHRDIKPRTLMMQGKEKRLMLIDFGAAQEGSVLKTVDMGEKAHAGTNYYMSPEQERGTEMLFPTSDIYSVGCILFELLTGGKPYKEARHHAPNATMSELMPDVPQPLIDVTEKALQPQPHERYLTAGEMLKALTAAQETLEGKPKSGVANLTTSRTALFGIGGLLVLGLLSALLFNLFNGSDNGNDNQEVAGSGATITPTPLPTSTPFPTVARAVETGVDQLLIPAGQFQMGSEDTAASADEKPVHTVTLDEFWMDKTEVTNAQYVAFLNDIGAATQDSVCVGLNCIRNEDAADAGRVKLDGEQYMVEDEFANHPVIFVTWKGADEYCRWRGAQLPTEAQWEKAARGLDQREYPTGRTIDKSLANYGRVFSTGTVEVGQYPSGASPYGVLDMAGNVWEWTADWYDKNYYAESPESNPTGAAAGDLRVVRGGSWNDYQSTIRASVRIRNLPDFGYNSVGFRCIDLAN